jgi:hypothetical protein
VSVREETAGMSEIAKCTGKRGGGRGQIAEKGTR